MSDVVNLLSSDEEETPRATSRKTQSKLAFLPAPLSPGDQRLGSEPKRDADVDDDDDDDDDDSEQFFTPYSAIEPTLVNSKLSYDVLLGLRPSKKKQKKRKGRRAPPLGATGMKVACGPKFNKLLTVSSASASASVSTERRQASGRSRESPLPPMKLVRHSSGLMGNKKVKKMAAQRKAAKKREKKLLAAERRGVESAWGITPTLPQSPAVSTSHLLARSESVPDIEEDESSSEPTEEPVWGSASSATKGSSATKRDAFASQPPGDSVAKKKKRRIVYLDDDEVEDDIEDDDDEDWD